MNRSARFTSPGGPFCRHRPTTGSNANDAPLNHLPHRRHLPNLVVRAAYDSDPLDDDLRKGGIEMVAPHRSNRRKRATQDGRRLRQYARRWLVERFFAWIQWQRRILVRWEYYPQNFLGFVQLACLVILFRRF